MNWRSVVCNHPHRIKLSIYLTTHCLTARAIFPCCDLDAVLFPHLAFGWSDDGELDAGKSGASTNSHEPGRPQLKDEGLGQEALDLLRLACPLIAYRGQTAPQGEQTLRAAALAAGVAPELLPTSLARLYDRVTIVLGAGARQLDRPQLWLYKDNGAPARLLAREGERLDDLRLLQYGNPAAADWFPRVLELGRGTTLVARFEALETRGFVNTGPGEDDEAQ